MLNSNLKLNAVCGRLTSKVNQIKTWAILLIALLSHSAFAFEAGIEGYGRDTNGVRHVNATEAAEILDKYPSVQVLDVRTGVEYNWGHISNAKNINYYSLNFRKHLDKLDKSTTWLVHCRTGVRSGKSLPIMQALGFTSLIHLDGGTSAWSEAGQPLQEN